ncbi:universal stress protein [Actinocrinis sp.]|uniref:universal stress protein n=1 Tax=Actinocrinis sp. TaxID=1920516 RepID=UPI002D24EB85|nr:universal stress protein [Actinocrinis sp.]HZP53348.1 universal stress protein [Actinocrinis sp.]
MDIGPGPRVFVGVDRSIPGLAALRFAVAEARRRGTDLHAVRVASVLTLTETKEIDAAFDEALGGFPADVTVHRELLVGAVADTLARRARNPEDVLIVGTDGAGRWHGLWSRSISRECLRKAHCPVLIVPGPQMAIEVRRRRWLPHHRELLSGLDFDAPIAQS